MQEPRFQSRPNSEDQEAKNHNKIIQKEFNEDELSLEVEEIADHSERGIIGEQNTFLALKNEKTYMVLTNWRGLKVIKNGAQIYSDKLPIETVVLAYFYATHLDCFFFVLNGKLYRKDIDDQPPQLCLEWEYAYINCFSYSPINQRLIILFSPANISVVNLDAKRLEFRLDKRGGFRGVIWKDFKVFGEKENKVITNSGTGYLWLFVFNFKMRKLLSLSQHEVDPNQDEKLILSPIAVSDLNDHVVVEFSISLRCKRILIFGVNQNILVKKVVYSPMYTTIVNNFSIYCCGCFRKHILWVGLELGTPSQAKITLYDVEKMDVRVLREKSVYSDSVFPRHMVRIENNRFYYTSRDGRIMKLTVKF